MTDSDQNVPVVVVVDVFGDSDRTNAYRMRPDLSRILKSLTRTNSQQGMSRIANRTTKKLTVNGDDRCHLMVTLHGLYRVFVKLIRT